MIRYPTFFPPALALDLAVPPAYTRHYRDRAPGADPYQWNEWEFSSMTDAVDPSRWVDTYGDYLYKFAFSRLRNATVAEDLVQETFLAGLKGRDRFAGSSTERTWLAGILKNKIIDHLRKSSREVPLEVEEQLPFEREGLFAESGEWRGHWDTEHSLAPSEWGNPADLFEKKEFLGIVRDCLETLPERMARVFTLRDCDDTPTKDVCELFQISEANLFVILHRARAQMRRCVERKWTGDSTRRGGARPA